MRPWQLSMWWSMWALLMNRAAVRRLYPSVAAGEWVQPIRHGYRMRCCDCGLVHRLQFRIEGDRVQFRAWRDNRATAAIRRKRRK